jgi:homoserine acetyltransferase
VDELKLLGKLLSAHGRDVEYAEHPSLFGHDAFLKEFAWLGPKISHFLHHHK